MAARIVVLTAGAEVDQNRSFEIHPELTEVRIGSGPGNQITLNDPAWQGTVRLERRQAAYCVTNEMPHAIYLGRQALAVNEQRLWHHGTHLQPTNRTVLVLYIEASRGAEEPGARPGVRETSARRQFSTERNLFYLAGTIVCVALLVMLLLMVSEPVSTEGRSPESLRRQYEEVQARLQKLRGHPEHGRWPAALLPLLTEARFHELWQRPEEAIKQYARARDELEAVLGDPSRARPLPPDLAATLRLARDFVNNRLIELKVSRPWFGQP
jgi:hypothetical protein